MKFEWDEVKNRLNIRKHGFDLSDVQKLFEGVSPFLAEPDDRKEYGEVRWKGVGILNGVVVVVVVFAERYEDTIRIISLRRANLQERMSYEEEIKNRLAKS